MKSQPAQSRPTLNYRRLGALGGASALLAALACSDSIDVTDLEVEAQPGVEATDTPSSTTHEPGYATELERALAENEARLAEWKREAAERAATLTEEERAALARYTAIAPEQQEAEWAALQQAALGAEEEQAAREVLASRGSSAADLHFLGRTVLDGDILHSVDDLLGTATVAKAHIPLGVQTVDPETGQPISPSSPDYIPVSPSSKTATDIRFWRPETNRKYYLVLADNAPAWLYNALTLATSDITSALSDDCLTNLFVVTSLTGYSQLDELTRLLGSEISVSRGANACSGRADACAGFPRTECLMQSPIDCLNRMRLGKFIRFDTSYDGNDDGVFDPVTESNARAVALHELTHILGFSHPNYPDFDPTDVAGRVRVPTTADGTVPSVMAPSSDPRFSSTITADDRQALRKTYTGSCAYQQGYRVMGLSCSATNEDRCLQHGGACEVDAAGTNVCRWSHHKDSNSCFRFSYGNWTTAAASVLPGEPGACVIAATSLPADAPLGTTATASSDLAGRRCIQDSGAPGVLFYGHSSAFATTFYCSDQKGVWDPDNWASWEFTNTAEEADFNETSGNWQMSSGNYTNWANESENFVIARGQSMTHGCISTKVTTTDNGFSGIVFNYRNSEDYYVLDLQPSVRRRIRRIGRLPDGTVASRSLSSINLNYAASWSPGITLTVCYGDGIHAFIDNGNLVSVTSAPDYFDDDRDGNVTEVRPVTFPSSLGFGLYNSFNQAGRHAYLRTFPLVHGFALAQ